MYSLKLSAWFRSCCLGLVTVCGLGCTVGHTSEVPAARQLSQAQLSADCDPHPTNLAALRAYATRAAVRPQLADPDEIHLPSRFPPHYTDFTYAVDLWGDTSLNQNSTSLCVLHANNGGLSKLLTNRLDTFSIVASAGLKQKLYGTDWDSGLPASIYGEYLQKYGLVATNEVSAGSEIATAVGGVDQFYAGLSARNRELDLGTFQKSAEQLSKVIIQHYDARNYTDFIALMKDAINHGGVVTAGVKFNAACINGIHVYLMLFSGANLLYAPNPGQAPLTTCFNTSGWHNLLFYGYYDVPGSKTAGVFVVKNSWSANSGDYGNYYISYNFLRELQSATQNFDFITQVPNLTAYPQLDAVVAKQKMLLRYTKDHNGSLNYQGPPFFSNDYLSNRAAITAVSYANFHDVYYTTTLNLTHCIGRNLSFCKRIDESFHSSPKSLAFAESIGFVLTTEGFIDFYQNDKFLQNYRLVGDYGTKLLTNISYDPGAGALYIAERKQILKCAGQSGEQIMDRLRNKGCVRIDDSFNGDVLRVAFRGNMGYAATSTGYVYQYVNDLYSGQHINLQNTLLLTGLDFDLPAQLVYVIGLSDGIPALSKCNLGLSECQIIDTFADMPYGISFSN